MKVILTDYVYKHGVAGDVVDVADGFARNWLIPRKVAIPASKANLEKMANLREKASTNRAEINDRINAAAAKINGTELVFGMKAGSNNKLYGSITSQMIKDAILEKTGVDINRRRISDRSIRELGRYELPVRMGDVSPIVTIVVMREEELASYLGTGSVETAVFNPIAVPAPVAVAADADADVAAMADADGAEGEATTEHAEAS